MAGAGSQGIKTKNASRKHRDNENCIEGASGISLVSMLNLN